MARIPTYTAQTQAVRRTGVSTLQPVKMTDYMSRATALVGKELSGIVDSFMEAADSDSAHQARLNATLKLNDLQLEMREHDPLTAVSEFGRRSREIIDNGAKGLSRNALENYNSAMFPVLARSQINVKKDVVNRGRLKLEANLVKNLDGWAKAVRPEDDDKDREIRQFNAKEAIQDAVDKRVIKADAGERLFIKFKEEADKARAVNDLDKDPVEFLRKLTDAKDKNYLRNLEADDRGKYITKAKQAIKRQERAAVTLNNAADRKNLKYLNSVIGAVSSGQNVTEQNMDLLRNREKMRLLFSDKAVAESVIARATDAVDFIDRTSGMEDLSLKDLRKLRDKFVSEGRDAEDLNVAQANRLQAVAVQRRYEQIIKYRQDDPAGAAMQGNDTVREAYSQWAETINNSDPVGDANAYNNYANARATEYDRLQIPVEDRRLLPKNMAKQTVEYFKTLNPSQAAQRLLEMRVAMGEDWPKAFEELQKEGMDKRAKMLMAVDNPATREDLVSAINNSTTEQWKKAIDSRVTGEVDKKIVTVMADITKAAGVTGFPLINSIRDAVQMLALQKIVTGNDNAISAVKNAYKEIVEENYFVINAGNMRGIISDKNVKFNGGKTNFVLSHWLNTNKDIQFSPEQFGIKPAIKPSDAQGIIRKALENDGMWHISSDGQTATLHMDRRKVFTSDGKEVILNIAPIGEVYNEYKQKIEQQKATGVPSSAIRAKRTLDKLKY